MGGKEARGIGRKEEEEGKKGGGEEGRKGEKGV